MTIYRKKEDSTIQLFLTLKNVIGTLLFLISSIFCAGYYVSQQINKLDNYEKHISHSEELLRLKSENIKEKVDNLEIRVESLEEHIRNYGKKDKF